MRCTYYHFIKIHQLFQYTVNNKESKYEWHCFMSVRLTYSVPKTYQLVCGNYYWFHCLICCYKISDLLTPIFDTFQSITGTKVFYENSAKLRCTWLKIFTILLIEDYPTHYILVLPAKGQFYYIINCNYISQLQP